MYYVVYNKNSKLCRIFNGLTKAMSYVSNQKGWVFGNNRIGIRYYKSAIEFVKKNMSKYKSIGSNGEIVYTPAEIKEVEKTLAETANRTYSESTKEETVKQNKTVKDTDVKENTPKSDVSKKETNNIVESSETFDDIFVFPDEVLSDKVVNEGKVMETKELPVEIKTESSVETKIEDFAETVVDNNIAYDFEQNFDVLIENLRNQIHTVAAENVEDVSEVSDKVPTMITIEQIDSIIQERIDKLLPKSKEIVEEVADVTEHETVSTIADLPNSVTGVNKQLISMLLQLDIFELQRLFDDFSTALVCVDGSFKQGIMSYAYVMITGGKVIEDADICCTEGKVPEKYTGNSTIAELISVKQAVAKAAAFGVKDLIICYDCECIMSTLSGISLRTVEQKQFKQYIDTMCNLIKLHFVKVKAHSGVPLHTRVDVLAGIKVGRSI